MRVRLLRMAARLGERAARGEHATRAAPPEVGQESGDRIEPPVILAHRPAGRSAGARPCTGDAGRSAGLGFALLHEPPRVEHAEAAAHPPDDPEVVADEQHGRMELRLQGGDEIEHLSFDGDVEPVVGSSRINSAGSVASAMAITTRCCMPPESWCGYRPITEPTSAIWTRSSACSACSGASSALAPRTRNTSAICFPTRMEGFSAAPGFWYTIDTESERSWRRSHARERGRLDRRC